VTFNAVFFVQGVGTSPLSSLTRAMWPLNDRVYQGRQFASHCQVSSFKPAIQELGG